MTVTLFINIVWSSCVMFQMHFEGSETLMLTLQTVKLTKYFWICFVV